MPMLFLSPKSARPESLLIAAGASAAFVGVGLARFAYTPLFPEMVAQEWLSPTGGAYLGAFNLAGYLFGVTQARRLALQWGLPVVMRWAMVFTALSFLGCAINLGVVWLCLWRALAGTTGGLLMVLAGPAIQAAVSEGRQGFAGGAVISGVGAGIMFGALVLPLFIGSGIPTIWGGLAALALVLAALTWRVWPEVVIHSTASTQAAFSARLLVLAYGLAGAGMLPHMVYLADLMVRGYGFSTGAASIAWFLFGAGAVLGTIAGGRAVDQVGGMRTMAIWLGGQVLSVSMLMLPYPPVMLVSSFIGGFCGIGLTAVVLGALRALSRTGAIAMWSSATAAFAICQALGSFCLAALYDIAGSHLPLVIAAWCFTVLAFALVLFVPRSRY